MLGAPNSRFSHGGYCKNRLFMEIVFKEFRDRSLVFFGCLRNRFSDFLGIENKLENKTIFYETQNLKKEAPRLPNSNPEKPKGVGGRGRSPEDSPHPGRGSRA